MIRAAVRTSFLFQNPRADPARGNLFPKGSSLMGARQKLNRAALNGVLLAGAILGAASQSWTVFLVATGLGIVLALIAGDIRPNQRRR